MPYLISPTRDLCYSLKHAFLCSILQQFTTTWSTLTIVLLAQLKIQERWVAAVTINVCGQRYHCQIGVKATNGLKLPEASRKDSVRCHVIPHFWKPLQASMLYGWALLGNPCDQNSTEHEFDRSITWVNWSRGGSHPTKFERKDVSEAFLNRVRHGFSCTYNRITTTVCFLFARKFQPRTLEPLLRIAPVLLGFNP